MNGLRTFINYEGVGHGGKPSPSQTLNLKP